MESSDSLSPLFNEFPPTSTEDWESTIRGDLRGKSYDKVLVWKSLEGVTLQPYYRRDDLDDLSHVDLDAERSPLVKPDRAPANDWRVRHDLSHPDLATANRLAHDALSNGVTDLGIAPRLRDLGSENARFDGVPVQCVDDLDALLDGVDLAETPLHLAGGPVAASMVALLQALARRRGVDADRLSGSADVDPLAALLRQQMTSAAHGYDVAASLVTDAPGSFRTLAADATPYHDAGASIVQEVALLLATVSEHLANLTERGVSVEAAADALHLLVPVSTSYFLEIAKLRALRLLVPQVIEPFSDAAGESADAAPADVFIQAVTSRRTLTGYAPYTNLLRGTTEALAAAVGGCDVLRVDPYDAAIRSESERSARFARNTQLILKLESHLDQVGDPAAGSYYVEAATDQIAEKAWAAFQEIEAEGGLLDGLRQGRIHDRLRDVHDQRTHEIETRRRVLVGTNHYPDLGETYGDENGAAPDASDPTPAAFTDWTVTVGTPSLGVLVDLVGQGATLGDVARVVSTGSEHNRTNGEAASDGAASDEETSTKTDVAPLPSARLAEPFEELRQRTDAHAREHDGAPVVFLLPTGDPTLRSARATFSRNFFGVAGFDVKEPLRFDSADDGVDAAADAGADVVVLCSSDEEYADLVSAARDAMTSAGLDARLVVAGNPERIDGDLSSADDFVHARSPLLETLQAFQDHLCT